MRVDSGSLKRTWAPPIAGLLLPTALASLLGVTNLWSWGSSEASQRRVEAQWKTAATALHQAAEGEGAREQPSLLHQNSLLGATCLFWPTRWGLTPRIHTEEGDRDQCTGSTSQRGLPLA
jgi:hypothetical protein